MGYYCIEQDRIKEKLFHLVSYIFEPSPNAGKQRVVKRFDKDYSVRFELILNSFKNLHNIHTFRHSAERIL